MNLFIEKLTEINEAIARFRKKEMTPEEVQAFVSLVNASHKWANSIIQAYAIESKNKRVLKQLGKINVLDEDTAIAIGATAEFSAVKCPERGDALIPLQECLDYSGSPGTDCSGCSTFQFSRSRLIDGE